MGVNIQGTLTILVTIFEKNSRLKCLKLHVLKRYMVFIIFISFCLEYLRAKWKLYSDSSLAAISQELDSPNHCFPRMFTKLCKLHSKEYKPEQRNARTDSSVCSVVTPKITSIEAMLAARSWHLFSYEWHQSDCKCSTNSQGAESEDTAASRMAATSLPAPYSLAQYTNAISSQ